MPDSRVDMAYDTAGLQDGAAGLRRSQTETDAATAALGAARLDHIMFGLTPGAPGFASQVQAARDAQARGFRQESQRAGDLAGRSDATAAAGDSLTGTTTAIAGSAHPSRAR